MPPFAATGSTTRTLAESRQPKVAAVLSWVVVSDFDQNENALPAVELSSMRQAFSPVAPSGACAALMTVVPLMAPALLSVHAPPSAVTGSGVVVPAA